VNTSGFVY